MSGGRSNRGREEADDKTADMPRRAFPIHTCRLPLFSPADDRTLEGLRRFLSACATDRQDFRPSPAEVGAQATRAEVLHIGDPDRLVMELVVIQASPQEFLAIYRAPPADVMTRLPELQLVDLKRQQARLTGPFAGDFVVSALTVDNISHLIILSQVRSTAAPRNEPATDEIEIDVEFDDDAS